MTSLTSTSPIPEFLGIHTLRDLNGERRARSGLGSSELTHRQFMLIELAGSPERYAVPKSTAPRFDGLNLRPRPRASDADAVSLTFRPSLMIFTCLA